MAIARRRSTSARTYRLWGEGAIVFRRLMHRLRLAGVAAAFEFVTA